jgi:hypothetical protein
MIASAQKCVLEMRSDPAAGRIRRGMTGVRAPPAARAKWQKFFGSFFQKRTTS